MTVMNEEVRGRGRPPVESRRENIVKTYLSDEELEMLRKYASDRGMSDSAALRSLVRLEGVGE